jgi:hypothetical protein
MKDIELKTDKGIPKVKIEVGYNQPVTYKSWLMSSAETKTSLGNDNEIDLSNAPGIKTVQDLIHKTFIWDVRVVSATGDANEKFHISVSFFQDNVPMCDPIVHQGKFEGNAAWNYDSAHFIKSASSNCL